MKLKEYTLTSKLEMLETVRRAIEHGIGEIRITDCSGDAIGYSVYMDLAGILDDQQTRYVTAFVASPWGSTTFAQQVQRHVDTVQALHDLRLSPAQVEDALMPLVHWLWAMPLDEAKAYIRESFTHEGHQALTVRLFKGETQEQPERWHVRANGQPLDTEA